MKRFNLTVVTALLSAAICTSTAYAATNDFHFVPQVGYQFQTSDTKGKQVADTGDFQKNRAVYGGALFVEAQPGTQVGIEYLGVNSNANTNQVGVIINQDLGKGFYALAGGGYYRYSDKYTTEGTETNLEGQEVSVFNDYTKKSFSSPYAVVGLGYKYPVTNMISIKTEIRGQYITNKEYFVPQALVGFDFNLNQITKPYS